MIGETIEILPAELENVEILAEISKRAFELDADVSSKVKGGLLRYDSHEKHEENVKIDGIEYLKAFYDCHSL